MTRNQHHLPTQLNVLHYVSNLLKIVIPTQVSNRQAHYLQAHTHQHHEPANKLPALSWTSQLLPFKLGSTNTGSMGPSNCGWLPTGTYLHPPPNKSTASNKMLTRKHGSNQISTEVTDLINKGAIIETQVVQQSFVSQIFLVEKKDGGQRPVVNLKCLNQYVKTEHFKMEGLHLLSGLLQAQDWMVKLDLKDAYLQVPIHPNHQHLLTYVPVGGKELHVQMPTIWPVLSTQSVHQIAEASGGLLEANRLSSNNISGQHANLAPEQEATTPDHPVDLPVAQGPGTYGQPEKVHNKPHSGVGVSGLSGGICINESVHSPRETAKDKARCKANVGLPTGDSEGSGTVCRESCSYTESHPFSSITLLSSPNINEFCPSPKLHTGGGEQEIRHSSDTDRSLQGGSNLVGFIGTEPPGNTSLPTMPYSDGALRCIQQGLGAVLNGQTQTGGQWSPEEATHHINYLELLAAFLAIKAFGKTWQGVTVSMRHRQHHSSKLYKSERRHNFQATLPAGFVNLDLVQ